LQSVCFVLVLFDSVCFIVRTEEFNFICCPVDALLLFVLQILFPDPNIHC
jgi:hypothetical protein